MTARRAKSITVEISIDPVLKDAAEIAADEDRRSLDNPIEKVLADYLIKHGYLTSKRSQPAEVGLSGGADAHKGWGKLIKDARRSLRLSHGQLAKPVGVTKAAISQWETEQFKPKRKYVRKLASVLGIERRELEMLLTEVPEGK